MKINIENSEKETIVIQNDDESMTNKTLPKKKKRNKLTEEQK